MHERQLVQHAKQPSGVADQRLIDGALLAPAGAFTTWNVSTKAPHSRTGGLTQGMPGHAKEQGDEQAQGFEVARQAGQ
jgi:hypothetical protein